MDYTRLFLYKIQKTWRLSCIFGYPQPSRILNLEYMPVVFKRVNIYSGYWGGKKVLQMHISLVWSCAFSTPLFYFMNRVEYAAVAGYLTTEAPSSYLHLHCSGWCVFLLLPGFLSPPSSGFFRATVWTISGMKSEVLSFPLGREYSCGGS